MTRKEIERESGCKVEGFSIIGSDGSGSYSVTDPLGRALEATEERPSAWPAAVWRRCWAPLRRQVRHRAKAHPRLAAALADGLTDRDFATQHDAWAAIEALL